VGAGDGGANAERDEGLAGGLRIGSIKEGRQMAKALLADKQRRHTADYWRAPRSYGSDEGPDGMRQVGYSAGYHLTPASGLPAEKQSFERSVFGKAAEARKLAALGLSHLTLPPQPSNYVSDFPQPQAPAAKGQEGGADFPGPLGGGGGGGNSETADGPLWTT